MFDLIPGAYRLIAGVVLYLIMAVGLVMLGWIKGSAHVQSKWDDSKLKQSAQIAIIEQKQLAATAQVVAQYTDRIKAIHDEGQAITKGVIVHVNQKTDSACRIPSGLVGLLNSAASCCISSPARNPNASSSVYGPIAR